MPTSAEISARRRRAILDDLAGLGSGLMGASTAGRSPGLMGSDIPRSPSRSDYLLRKMMEEEERRKALNIASLSQPQPTMSQSQGGSSSFPGGQSFGRLLNSGGGLGGLGGGISPIASGGGAAVSGGFPSFGASGVGSGIGGAPGGLSAAGGASGAAGGGGSALGAFAPALGYAYAIGAGKMLEYKLAQDDPDNPISGLGLSFLGPSINQFKEDPKLLATTALGFPFLNMFIANDEARQAEPEFAPLWNGLGLGFGII